MAGHRGGAPAGDGQRHRCDEQLYDREFVRRWVNWDEYLREEHPDAPGDVRGRSSGALHELYAEYTPEFAEAESRRPGRADRRGGAARSAARGHALATHVWRARRPATSAAGRSRAR